MNFEMFNNNLLIIYNNQRKGNVIQEQKENIRSNFGELAFRIFG